jgi:hypothetical protein
MAICIGRTTLGGNRAQIKSPALVAARRGRSTNAGSFGYWDLRYWRMQESIEPCNSIERSSRTVLPLRASCQLGSIFKVAGRTGVVATLVLTLSVMITYVSIRLSFKIGRLSVPPLWDDVSYFIAATRWLSAAGNRWFGESLYALLDQHAPFSTLTAIIGFTLIPDGYIGPYAVNGVIIAAFLLGIARCVWHLSVLDIATCIVAVACVPMLSQAIAEARPDLAWGMALGMAVGGIVYKPLSGRTGRSLFFLGMLCGLAVAIKPTAFFASTACILFAVCAVLACDWLQSEVRDIRSAVKKLMPIMLVFLLGLTVGIATILSVGFMKTVNYILTILIDTRDFWATQESAYGHLIYYSFGTAGKIALGKWLWIGVALFAFRLGIATLRDRTDIGRTLTLLAIVLTAYAIPTSSVVKAYFWGAIFYGVFVVSMVLNFSAIIGSLNATHAGNPMKGADSGWLIALVMRLAPLAVVSFVFIARLLPGNTNLATTLDPNSILDIRAATDQVWSLLKENLIYQQQHHLDRKTVVVKFSSPYPVTSSAIQLYAMHAHAKLDARGSFFIRALDEAAKDMTAADFAVVTSTMPHGLPGPRMGDDLIRLLDADPHMCLVESMGLLNAARVMRIYHHSDLGCVAGGK